MVLKSISEPLFLTIARLKYFLPKVCPFKNTGTTIVYKIIPIRESAPEKNAAIYNATIFTVDLFIETFTNEITAGILATIIIANTINVSNNIASKRCPINVFFIFNQRLPLYSCMLLIFDLSLPLIIF